MRAMTTTRSRMRDPGLAATPSADPTTVRITLEYLAGGTTRLLVGTTAGSAW